MSPVKLYRAIYVGQDPFLQTRWAKNGFCVARNFGEMAEVLIGEEYALVPRNELVRLPDKDVEIPMAEEYNEPFILPPQELVQYTNGKDIEWLLENPNGFTVQQVSMAFIWWGRVRLLAELSPYLLSTEWEYARKSIPVFMKLIQELK